MKLVLQSFFKVFEVIKNDKLIILFSMLPIIIGVFLFSTVGTYIYTDGVAWGEKIIGSNINSENWNSFIRYFVITLLTTGFYFLLSLGFVLIVTVIASPFNDIISERTERFLIGKENSQFSESFKRLISNFFITIVNEIKKITLVITLSIVALLMGFIPFLIPIGIIISALLIAITFLDYSWSRKKLTFRECVSDVRKNFFSYALSGAGFLLFISLPFINLIILPFGVIFFTVLFVEGQRYE